MIRGFDGMYDYKEQIFLNRLAKPLVTCLDATDENAKTHDTPFSNHRHVQHNEESECTVKAAVLSVSGAYASAIQIPNNDHGYIELLLWRERPFECIGDEKASNDVHLSAAWCCIGSVSVPRAKHNLMLMQWVGDMEDEHTHPSASTCVDNSGMFEESDVSDVYGTFHDKVSEALVVLLPVNNEDSNGVFISFLATDSLRDAGDLSGAMGNISTTVSLWKSSDCVHDEVVGFHVCLSNANVNTHCTSRSWESSLFSSNGVCIMIWSMSRVWMVCMRCVYATSANTGSFTTQCELVWTDVSALIYVM